MVKPIPVCVPRRMAACYLEPDLDVIHVYGQDLEWIPQPRSLVSSLPGPARPEWGYDTNCENYIG